MKKTILWTCVFVIAMVSGLFVLATYGENNAVASVQSALTVDKVSYDFGTIDIFGGNVETVYQLENKGTEPIVITNAQTSCMCTEGEIEGLRFGMHGGELDSLQIPAGSKKELTAIFDPLAHGPNGTGKITRELILRTNSEKTPHLRLRFSADVVKE